MVKSRASNTRYLPQRRKDAKKDHQDEFGCLCVFASLRETTSLASRPLQQINKQRRTDQRGDRADRQLSGRDERAGDGVGYDHEYRAAECRRGYADAVVAAE